MSGQLSIWGDEWINKRDQLPTAEDGNYKGEVLAWHKELGLMVTGWFIIEASDMFTHWMRTPGKPGDAKGRSAGQGYRYREAAHN